MPGLKTEVRQGLFHHPPDLGQFQVSYASLMGMFDISGRIVSAVFNFESDFSICIAEWNAFQNEAIHLFNAEDVFEFIVVQDILPDFNIGNHKVNHSQAVL